MSRARFRPFVGTVLASCLLVAVWPQTVAAEPRQSAGSRFDSLQAEVEVGGMTFVGSRDDVDEFVVHATTGVFVPGTRLAHLQDVDVVSAKGVDGHEFTVSCDKGELNVETSDFLAEGHVEGSVADGRRYNAPWVRYDHEKALLYTDAPVVMQDSTGTFRGDGFRYFVNEQRFKLLGNVSLVQTP